jgi:hypothetical protein
VFLQGDIQHKSLWVINLDTKAERQLTNRIRFSTVVTSIFHQMAVRSFPSECRSVRSRADGSFASVSSEINSGRATVADPLIAIRH